MQSHSSFRRAEESDLSAAAAIIAGAVEKMRREGIDQWDERYPSARDLALDIARGELTLLVGEKGPEALFVLNAEQTPDYENGSWREKERFLVLHRLCVAAGAQGKGVASKALARAEEMAKKAGARSLRLDAFRENPAALRLYEGRGYVRRGEISIRKGVFYLYEKCF